MESADRLPAGIAPGIEIDEFPTRRSGPRRVYGSTNVPAAPLADVTAHAGDPLARMLGKVLDGRYEIDAVIGRRALGTAYRAVDRSAPEDGPRRRFVALTLLDGAVARDRQAMDRVRQCGDAVRALDHPALDAPSRIVEEGDRPFLVSAHRSGRLLADLLGRTDGVGWPLRSVLPVGYRIADALGHAHRAGIAHGALDAASVLLTAEDEVVLLDLGGRSVLTGRDSSPGDDVLGLARLVLALLTGGVPRSPGRATPTRPPGLRDTAWAGLLEGLASDPLLRPVTPEALMVSLEDPGWFRRLVGRRPHR